MRRPLLDGTELPTRATQDMLAILEEVAKNSDVGLFRRFEIMRYWHLNNGVPFAQMIGNADGHWLHQNAWSYDAIAKALCASLVDATQLSSS